MTLADFAVYTILHPDRLDAIARTNGSTRLRETKRWVTAKRIFDEARVGGHDVVVLYADAAVDCSRLIFSGIVESLDVDENGTTYSVRDVVPLRGHRTQELVLHSSGTNIAEGYRRPYAVVHTPAFVRKRRSTSAVTSSRASATPVTQPDSPPAASFLLTWNPDRWNWSTLAEDLVQVAVGRPVEMRWITGRTRRIAAGDHLFLLKQGVAPRGLMASGIASSSVFDGKHWDPTRATAGDDASYVNARFDRLVAPDGVLPVEQLERGTLAAMDWHPVAGGRAIPPELVGALEEIWNAYVPPRSPLALPDELTPGVRYVEGAPLSAVVNRYERDPAARLACLNAHATCCVVCGFSFGRAYGVRGEGFIHVHHLEPISTGRQAREVDPVRDLRPVCPNCHAMLHRSPPTSIEELRATLAHPT